MNAFQRYADSIVVDAPIAEVFAFYTSVENLMRMLSPSLLVKVLRADEPLKVGSRVEFEVGPKNLPISVRWASEIVAFEPPTLFEDRQANGPFSRWQHRHEFTALSESSTKITDIIEVGAAKGILGQAINSMLLGKNIDELFAYRRKVLEEKFGTVRPAE